MIINNYTLIITMVGSAVVGIIIYFFQKWRDRKRDELIERLRSTGAIAFVSQLLGIKETLAATEEVPISSTTEGIVAARALQRAVHARERSVTAIVCGEEVVGVMENCVMDVVASSVDAKWAIRSALSFCQGMDMYLYLGIPCIKLRFTDIPAAEAGRKV